MKKTAMIMQQQQQHDDGFVNCDLMNLGDYLVYFVAMNHMSLSICYCLCVNHQIVSLHENRTKGKLKKKLCLQKHISLDIVHGIYIIYIAKI